MLLDCFGETVEINDYDLNGIKYADCVIRKQRVILLPEEQVRQAFILYMIKNTEINQQNYSIKVEFKNLDIAVYDKYTDVNFQPACYPRLIIELKRVGVNILNHEQQLLNYLQMNCCPCGFLTNCQQTYIYDVRNSFKRRNINLIKQLDQLDIRSSNEDIECFRLAKSGDSESFIYLIKKYGPNSRFKFICSDYKSPVVAFLLSYSNNHVFFDFCGISSKREQPRIGINSFIKLVSIEE